MSSNIDNFRMTIASTASESPSPNGDATAWRRDAMALLVEGETAELAGLLNAVGELPVHEDIRRAECGLVMVRGRIGGDGAPFNLGEATVARAAVRLASGEVGFGYVLGRDCEKARLAALCDALLQSDRYRAARRTSRAGADPDPSCRGAQACSGADGSDACRVLHPGARGGRTMTAAATSGFADPVLSAQSVFRAIMDATARPGSIQSIEGLASAPAPLSAGAAAIALTLLDQDTPVWLDGALAARPEVADWIRFHTGSPIVTDPSRSAFALICCTGAIAAVRRIRLRHAANTRIGPRRLFCRSNHSRTARHSP